jgi:hypothetical protein
LNSSSPQATGINRRLRARPGKPYPSDAVLFWAVFATACAFSAASLQRGSYFLHWDVASQHVAALDFLRGCWGYDAGKPLIMFVLALTYGLFGASPVLESALLVLAAGLAAASLFLVARTALPGRGWALAATLWYFAWPTTLYYTRIHLGYPLALFLAGLAAGTRGHDFLSGALLALGILAHPGLALPALAWLAAAAALSQQRSLKRMLMRVAGSALTLLLLEALRYAYTGETFGWWQGQLTDVRAYSGTGGGTRWSHVLEAFWLANGGLHATLCLIGIAAFLATVRRHGRSPGDPVFATALTVFAFYAVRTGAGVAGFNMRLLLGVKPLLAITAMTGVAHAIPARRWSPRPPARALLATLLLVPAVSGFASARRISGSAYPELERAFLQATSLSIPVRYFGQPYAALFFGVKHNVETLANASDFNTVPLHTPAAVVVVEARTSADTRPVAQALAAADIVEYDYRALPHPILSSRLRAMEEAFFPSTRQLWEIARTPDPEKPELAIWVPRNPSVVPPASYTDAGQVPYEWLSYYYHGDGGCQIVPRDHPYAWRYYRYLLPRLRQLLK